MKTMQCHELENYLEQREADALSTDAAAHLSDCGRCRALVSDLETIQAAAGTLNAELPEPPERVWRSLRAQLTAEGIIRTRDEAGARGAWLGWLGAWSRPALAGAYLACLVVAAVLIALQGDFSPNRTASTLEMQHTAALDRQLNTIERHTVSSLRQRDPVVVASLRQNLDIVDNSIALCEKSLHQDPQNELARESLYSAYQQKAQLLAMMVDRDRDVVGD